MDKWQNRPAKTSSKAIQLYPFFESNKKPSHINLLGKKRCRRQVQKHESTPFCKWSGHTPSRMAEKLFWQTLCMRMCEQNGRHVLSLIPWCSHRTCGILRLTEQPWALQVLSSAFSVQKRSQFGCRHRGGLKSTNSQDKNTVYPSLTIIAMSDFHSFWQYLWWPSALKPRLFCLHISGCISSCDGLSIVSCCSTSSPSA